MDVTIPLPDEIDADKAFEVDHAPPATELVNVVNVPSHAVNVPPIVPGFANTVTVLVTEGVHPVL